LGRNQCQCPCASCHPEGKVILQQRDNNPGIVNPGLISMFGGTLKLEDSPELGLKRELEEELELKIENYQVETLGVFYKTKALDGVDLTGKGKNAGFESL
jgi:8-oxo-dGTP pyrophosphatase MutT (NUDIX family)